MINEMARMIMTVSSLKMILSQFVGMTPATTEISISTDNVKYFIPSASCIVLFMVSKPAIAALNFEHICAFIRK